MNENLTEKEKEEYKNIQEFIEINKNNKYFSSLDPNQDFF